jgi:hypothetical protein
MTCPTVIGVPPVLAPLTPNTFVFAVVRNAAAARRRLPAGDGLHLADDPALR